MPTLNRRQFAASLAALSVRPRRLLGRTSLDETLRLALERRKIPSAAAMVANGDQITYAGAHGRRDSASDIKITPESIFFIASMTKAVTSVAALQLVEQGKVALEEPVARHLPQLAGLQILDGFEHDQPVLRPASRPITLHHLLTHTSGFAYDTWDAEMRRYNQMAREKSSDPLVTPLRFEPGTRWEYGTSVDWAGRLVEAVSGLTLEQYFERNILSPLGMKDTGFSVPAAKFDRLITGYQRETDGSLKESPRKLPDPPKTFSGGGGLYSSAADYTRFMQMILRGGRAGGRDRILQAKTVEMMSANQIGNLSAGKMKSVRPAISADVDFHPGFTDKFGFGFLINTVDYPGGRSAGSLAWAGVDNTYYWIDARRHLCAVLMMQFLPFADPDALSVLREFEQAVYAA